MQKQGALAFLSMYPKISPPPPSARATQGTVKGGAGPPIHPTSSRQAGWGGSTRTGGGSQLGCGKDFRQLSHVRTVPTAEMKGNHNHHFSLPPHPSYPHTPFFRRNYSLAILYPFSLLGNGFCGDLPVNILESGKLFSPFSGKPRWRQYVHDRCARTTGGRAGGSFFSPMLVLI